MIRDDEESEPMNRTFETTSGGAERGPDGCIEMVELLHAHAEGELDPIRGRRVDEHLAGCEACREALRELQEERLWCMELLVSSPPLSPRFAEKVTGRIRARMRIDAARKRRAWIARGAAAAALIGVVCIFAARGPGEPGSSSVVLSPTEPRSAPVAEAEDSPGIGLASQGPGRFQRRMNWDGPVPLEPQDDYRIHARPFRSFIEYTWCMVEQAAPSRWGVPKDPCAPDPNRDGRTDYRDVVHFVSVDIGGASEVAVGSDVDMDGTQGDDDRSPGEPDCDELCLRA